MSFNVTDPRDGADRDAPGPRQDPGAEAGSDPLERAKAELAAAKAEAAEARAAAQSLGAQIEELKSLAATPPEEAKDLQRLHLLQIQPVRDILVLLLVFGMFWLGYKLRAVTIPMLLALALAYLVEPLVARAVRRGWTTRAGAASIIIAVIVLLVAVPLGAGVTVGVSQGLSYAQTVRGNITLVQEYLTQPKTPESDERLKSAGRAWYWVGNFLKGMEEGTVGPQAPAPEGATPAEQPAEAGGTPRGAGGGIHPAPEARPGDGSPGGPISESVSSWAERLLESNMQGVGRVVARQLIGTGADAVELSLRVLGTIGYLVFAFFLVMFFFFFFCTGWAKVEHALTGLIPKWKKGRTLDMLRQMDGVISGFVRGRLIIMAIMMVLFAVGYWLIGVPAPLVVGPVVGILAIVPYLGLVSIPVSIGLMWLQPVGAPWQQTWWWILAAPLVLYFLIQTIDDYLLTPLIQGKTTQMDVPTILFAVLAGGILAGFYGVLLAIPVGACVKILLRESFWPRFRAWAEGRVKDFLPISRYDPTDTAGGP